MREQKQKIKISLLDLRKFVGVDRFRLIDTVFGNKNTYPRLNYFSSEPVHRLSDGGEHRFSLISFSPAYYYMNAWKWLLFSFPLL